MRVRCPSSIFAVPVSQAKLQVVSLDIGFQPIASLGAERDLRFQGKHGKCDPVLIYVTDMSNSYISFGVDSCPQGQDFALRKIVQLHTQR